VTANGTARALGIVEGVVEAVNPNGVKIAGEWSNISKFKPVELPAVGTHVRLEVDGRGYIRSVEVLAANASETRLPPGSTLTAALERDQRGARLTVLNAAAVFAAARTDIKSGDVLRIADAWLAWVESTLNP
jgi:hypothetical protein